MRAVRVTFVTNEQCAPLYSFCSVEGEWFHLERSKVKGDISSLVPGKTTGYVVYMSTPNMGWYEFTQVDPRVSTSQSIRAQSGLYSHTIHHPTSNEVVAHVFLSDGALFPISPANVYFDRLEKGTAVVLIYVAPGLDATKSYWSAYPSVGGE